MICGSALGTVPLGGSMGQIPLEVYEGPQIDLVLEIQGQDLSSYLVMESLAIRESVNLRGEASFQLTSPTGNLHVAMGAPVRIRYKGTTIFGGDIDEIEERVPDNSSAIWIDVTCTDWSHLFDRHLVNHIYESEYMHYIVTSIVLLDSGALGETLDDEGIICMKSWNELSDFIQLGPLMSRLVFKNMKASECLDKICELTGYSWWVDSEKYLHVEDCSRNRAPFPLKEIEHANYGETAHSMNRESYRNVQYLEAGKTTTAEVTASNARHQRFLGDGKQKTWTLDLPLADKPLIYINDVQVNPNKIAIRETDDSAEWYYELDDEKIAQNWDDDIVAPIADGIEIEVIYKGYYPIIQYARDDEQIAERQGIEGGCGIYEEVEADESIDDSVLATQLVQAKLRKNGRMPRVITARTTTPGYHAGQLVEILAPEYNSLGDWLIEEVELSFLGWDEEEPFRYSIRAINGEPQWGAVEFYRKAAEKGRPYQYSENETIHVLRQFREKLKVSDTLHILTGDQTIPWSWNYGTIWVIGISPIGSQREPTEGLGETVGGVAGPMLGLSAVLS